MSTSEAVLPPYTDILREECRRVRILVVGKSGAGKSALINAVFGVEGAAAVAHWTPGKHDIDEAHSFPTNDRIIIHDSQGFEAGEEANINKVLDFIDRRSKMPALGDQLHAIWVCAEIPFAGGRLFETGVEQILKGSWEIPIIVVFTKLDVLRDHQEVKLNEELEERGEDIDDDEFDAKIDTLVDQEMRDRCIVPLCTLLESDSPKYPWVATSTDSKPQFKNTIAELVNLALKCIDLERVWIGLATAQRSNAKASIEASIRVGRKRYWRGLFSDILLGFSMRSVLNVLQRDIVNVWNMHDPDSHLHAPEFLALLSVLVEDLSDETTNDYPLTKKAVDAIIEHPASIIIAGPTAIVVLFAEWLQGTYKQTKNSLRCLIGCIIDLTLIMDTLFYLVLSRGQTPMKITLINKALRIYKDRKSPVHTSIRAWADGWGTFSHLDESAAMKKIEQIIHVHSVKPEQWDMQDELSDESWMAPDTLRET